MKLEDYASLYLTDRDTSHWQLHGSNKMIKTTSLGNGYYLVENFTRGTWGKVGTLTMETLAQWASYVQI
jgi:hypothetical protein